jgi:acetolactate synthase-1/2/3 large subunit
MSWCGEEENAAFAAEGYARATGKVGVCCATSGPGATHLITGLVDSLMDSISSSPSPGRCIAR